MEQPAGTNKVSARIAIISVAILFLGPLIAAWWWYSGPDRSVAIDRIGYGLRLDPVRALPMTNFIGPDGEETDNDVLLGKWSLIFVGGTSCDTVCDATLAMTQHLRNALGRDAGRVQRVYFFQSDNGKVAAGDSDLIVLRADRETGGEVLDVFPLYNGVPLQEANRLYLVDPDGNLIMSFPENADAARVLQELQLLLKFSKTG